MQWCCLPGQNFGVYLPCRFFLYRCWRKSLQWQEVLTQTHMISSIYGDMTMYQGLTNSRSDGYGALAQQSAVAILNGYSHPVKYALIPIQVRLKFRNALVIEQSVFHTAREFETANTSLAQEHLETDGDCSSHGQASIVQSPTEPPVLQNEDPFLASNSLSAASSSMVMSSDGKDAGVLQQHSASVHFESLQQIQQTNSPLITPTVTSYCHPQVPDDTHRMCTQEAITYLDNIDLRADVNMHWKGYKLFCFSHYSQSALLKAQFLSSKVRWFSTLCRKV